MGFDTTPSVVVHRQFAASQQLSANGQTEPTAERIPRLLVPAKTNLPEIVKRLQKKRRRILAEGSLGTDAVYPGRMWKERKCVEVLGRYPAGRQFRKLANVADGSAGGSVDRNDFMNLAMGCGLSLGNAIDSNYHCTPRVSLTTNQTC